METPEAYLKQAFAALLRGDTKERDRLCDLATKAHDEQERLLKLNPTDPVSKN